jgi:hypothetical protein
MLDLAVTLRRSCRRRSAASDLCRACKRRVVKESFYVPVTAYCLRLESSGRSPSVGDKHTQRLRESISKSMPQIHGNPPRSPGRQAADRPINCFQSLGCKEDDRTLSRSPNLAEEKKSGSMPFQTGAFAASVAFTVSAQESASLPLFPK